MNMMPSIEEYIRQVKAEALAAKERQDAQERLFLRELDWSEDQWAAYVMRVNGIHSRHGMYLQRMR